jgi:hypothetical protein
VADGKLKISRNRPGGAGVDFVGISELHSFRAPFETHNLRAIFADAMRAAHFSDASGC